MLVCCFGHPYSTLTPTLIFSVPQNWRRRLPAGWEEAMLPHLLSWLVGQCGAPQTEPACLFPPARGADAASAGRRRRRQSPGACAVRGPPETSVRRRRQPAGRHPAGVAGRRQLGAAVRRVTDRPCRARSRRRWPTVSGVTRMGYFFLLHRCCECWPLSGSD